MTAKEKTMEQWQELKRVVHNFGMSRIIVFGFFILLLCLTKAQDFPSTITNILNRVGMNGILVLCMIPSIRAGLGPNFAVPFGVLAGLLGALIPVELGMSGLPALMTAIALAIIIAIPFGIVFGLLMNSVRGSEMMISTYFGYAMVYILCIAWLVLPFKNNAIVMSMGAGLRNTINLEAYFGGVLSNLFGYSKSFQAGEVWMIPVWAWVLFAVVAFVVYFLLIHSPSIDAETMDIEKIQQTQKKNVMKRTIGLVTIGLAAAATLVITFGAQAVQPIHDMLSVGLTFTANTSLFVPTGSLLFFLVACGLMWVFNQSRTGIAMYAAGSNASFAQASGIAINQQRMLGSILTTAIAAVGIVIYAQGYGFIQLYSAPLNMCFPPVAAILIGGASITNAKISHVIIGVVLFQGILTMGPTVASQYLAGLSAGVDPTEIMRIIITNGIILYALTKAKGD